jgi:hypothetical protein
MERRSLKRSGNVNATEWQERYLAWLDQNLGGADVNWWRCVAHIAESFPTGFDRDVGAHPAVDFLMGLNGTELDVRLVGIKRDTTKCICSAIRRFRFDWQEQTDVALESEKVLAGYESKYPHATFRYEDAVAAPMNATLSTLQAALHTYIRPEWVVAGLTRFELSHNPHKASQPHSDTGDGCGGHYEDVLDRVRSASRSGGSQAQGGRRTAVERGREG